MPEQGDFRSAITTDSLMHPFRLRRRMLVSCFGPPRIAIPISWSASFRTAAVLSLRYVGNGPLGRTDPSGRTPLGQ